MSSKQSPTKNAETEEQDRVEECMASFALASDGHVYIHEDELPADKRRGRKEWRGVRLTRAETEFFAEEVELIMPNVAVALRSAIEKGKLGGQELTEGEPMSTGGSKQESGDF
ncbi:hypothetical protein [Polyangium mundeleinium]|uniref:Uncharacterized protein n=1 Tax=Polyangium mundeleinium TaxID=2995306 RepID=A0ABT5ER04_9BACT|nr:hypothetical protein [Polyangium mundeleinium]MDC0743200.1 hypothetical protein [Polyangium mundeleinium]